MRDGQPFLAATPIVQADTDGNDLRARVRAYIVGNFLLGDGQSVDDDASLMEAGILDSTGALEVVAFLESTFGVGVRDNEIIADNLDTIGRIGRFVERKLAAGA